MRRARAAKLDAHFAETGRAKAMFRKMPGKILGEPEPYLDMERQILMREGLSGLGLKR
jgi:hypothetical protein